MTVTWVDGPGRLEPTTYRVLRRPAGTTAGDEWTTVTTVELDDSDERRYVDRTVEPDTATRTLEYAVSVDDPSCGPSDVCPEFPETCASVVLPTATTDP